MPALEDFWSFPILDSPITTPEKRCVIQRRASFDDLLVRRCARNLFGSGDTDIDNTDDEVVVDGRGGKLSSFTAIDLPTSQDEQSSGQNNPTTHEQTQPKLLTQPEQHQQQCHLLNQTPQSQKQNAVPDTQPQVQSLTHKGKPQEETPNSNQQHYPQQLLPIQQQQISLNIKTPQTPSMLTPSTRKSSRSLQKLQGNVSFEKIVFRHWRYWKQRYVEFDPVSRCIFYWRRESDKLKGRAKCLDGVVSAEVLKSVPGKPDFFHRLKLRYGGGNCTTIMRFVSLEAVTEWAKALSVEPVPEPSTQLHSPATSASHSKSGDEDREKLSWKASVRTTPSKIESAATNEDTDENPEVSRIRGIFASEFRKQSSFRQKRMSTGSRGARSDSCASTECSLFRQSYNSFAGFGGSRNDFPPLATAL
jgi:hypothetical protein